MPKLIKNLSLILLSSILFLNSMAMPFAVANAAPNPPPPSAAPSSAPASAPSTWYNQGFTDWYAKVYGDESPPSEIFGERYTAAQVQWIVYGLISLPINFLGSNVSEIVACALSAQSGGTNIIADAVCAKKVVDFLVPILQNAPWSPLSVNSNVQPNLTFAQSITSDYQKRPISGIKYTANLISKFTSIPTANAQGYGYTANDSLKKYWSGFRDIAYALTVLVVIVFAFMIMFRVKLSPQVVISVQSALPKVFMALILATFSYAIAGFVIDLSYVVGGLLASLMSLAGFSVATAASGSTPAMSAFQNAFRQIVPIEGTTALGAFYIFGYMIAYSITFFVTAVIACFSTIVGLSVYGFLAGIIMILFTVWVLILMVWYTLTLPFKLIKTLISLLISIVIAPVQIVLGAIIPSIGFGIWFRKIIAEALVFPLTGLFLFLASVTLTASMRASFGQMWQALVSLLPFLPQVTGENLWSPPILGSSTDMAGILWLAVSFTFITMIPKAVDIMKTLVMGAKFDFGSAMGEAMAPAKMAGGLYSGQKLATREAEARAKPGDTPFSQAWAKGYKETAKYFGETIVNKVSTGR